MGRRLGRGQKVDTDQIAPAELWSTLKWLDGRPLLEVMEAYRQRILHDALFTFREDGAPRYRRILTGRAKKNSKTSDAVLASLYKLLVWRPWGEKGAQVYFVASDLGQANDDLDLTKKLVRCNPVLDSELVIKSNLVERRDGKGFIEILPAGDVTGLHGKTYLFLVVDELHTQRDYRVLEALELDRTRPDAMQWFASYASIYRQPGVPLNDILKQDMAKTDPRLYVSWYAGSIEEANPSLNGPLGPTTADMEDARRSLPSWVFRRLCLNLPGQPDGAAFDATAVEQCVVQNRKVLSPVPETKYYAFVDMSGGGADDATLAIAHMDGGRAVLDLILDQGPRTGGIFDPQRTAEKFAKVLDLYGCSRVTGDRYAGQWPVQAFNKAGISYEVSTRNRSEIYACLEPLINGYQVALLDHPTMFAQIIGLIRKGEKIDHATGEHDDLANAAAGALVQAHAASRITAHIWIPDGIVPGDKPVPADHKQLLRSPYGLLIQPHDPEALTCADCSGFDQKSGRCGPRKFVTQPHMPACNVFESDFQR